MIVHGPFFSFFLWFERTFSELVCLDGDGCLNGFRILCGDECPEDFFVCISLALVALIFIMMRKIVLDPFFCCFMGVEWLFG